MRIDTITTDAQSVHHSPSDMLEDALPPVAARGCLPPGENVFVAAPTPAIRTPIVTSILMVTTMALMWTVNSTLSWGCKVSEFHIFALPNAAPCTVPLRADAPVRPLPSFRRHCLPLVVCSDPRHAKLQQALLQFVIVMFCTR